MERKLIEVIAPKILLFRKSKNTSIPIESYHKLFFKENKGCLLLKCVGPVDFGENKSVRGYQNLVLSNNKEDDSFLKSKVRSVEIVEDKITQIELIKSINKQYKNQIGLFRRSRKKIDDWIKYYFSFLASLFLSLFSIQTIDFIIQEFSTAPVWAIEILIALTTVSLFSLGILIWYVIKFSNQRKREEKANDETEEFLDEMLIEDIINSQKYQVFFIYWINGSITYHFLLPGVIFKNYIQKINSSKSEIIKYIVTDGGCFLGYSLNKKRK